MSRYDVRPARSMYRLRRLLVAAVCPVLLLTQAVTPASAQASAQASDGLEDLPEPTERQLAAAVQRWEPAGSVRVWNPAGSVWVWDPHGHVSPMESRSKEGTETVVTLKADVLFAFGSAEVPPQAAERIAAQTASIPTGAVVAVEGHTDSIGSAESNLRLSQERAEAVAAVIAEVRDDLVLEVTGFGETRPVAPNSTGGQDNPQGRAQNRRVEIRYEG